MSANPKETADSTASFHKFTDWSDNPADQYQHSNDEIVEFFGNDIQEPDTNNATCIRHDIDGDKPNIDRLYWRKMSLYNCGICNREWVNEAYRTYLVNNGLVMALMCQLDLTKRQRQRVYPFVMGLDFRKLGKKAELSAFCAITAIVNNDDTIRGYYPNQKDPDKEFAKIKKELDLSDTDVYSMLSKLDPANPQNVHEYSTRYLEFRKREPDIGS
jgi:hypothetical protein